MSGFLVVKILKQGEKHDVELFQGSYNEAIERAQGCLNEDVTKVLLFEEIAEIENAPVVRNIKVSAAASVTETKQSSPPVEAPLPVASRRVSPRLLKDLFQSNSAVVQCGCGSQFTYSPSQTTCPSCKQAFPIEQARQARYG